MKMSRRPIGLLCCLFTVPVFAGTVFEFETKEFDGPEPILGTVQMSTAGANTRLEIISVTSDEAGGLIYLGAAKKMIILDHLQGQYINLDQAQLQAMAEQAALAMAQMQEDAENIPPGEREASAQMMQQQANAPSPDTSTTDIRSLGSRGEVAGVPCRNYEVLLNGRKTRELCVSQWGDLHGGEETAAAIRGVVEFFEMMRQAFASTGDMDVIDRQQELFGHMGELDGYPILYRDFGPGGRLIRETRLTAARQRDLAAEFFAPPRGYSLQDLAQGL